MKALVIGGTGPTGPYVVEGLLERGYQVTILHRGTHEVEFSKPVEHIHGDPHFEDTLEAALGKNTYDVTVALYGRLRFVAQVMRGKTGQFLAVGGVAVYKGWSNPALTGPCPFPAREDSPLQTDPDLENFSHLMYISEQAALEAHRQGHYRATVFRYPLIYGPRQLAPREWSLIRRFLDGRREIILPDAGLVLETRGYVENMAHTVLLAIDHPKAASGQVYNVGDDAVLNQREWVEVVGKALGCQFEIVDMPGRMARPSRPYAGRSHHRVLDISKIKAQLGYRDIVPVEEALRRTVKWYQDNPPPPGGELEKQLNDPFNYDYEDRLIAQHRQATEALLAIPFQREKFRHPYPHPKRPGT